MTNPYASGRAWTKEEEKLAAVLVHIVAIFLEWIAPIVGYVLLKDKGPFISHHVKESLNFSNTVGLIAVALAISIVGWLIIRAVPAYWVIMRIIAAAKTAQGEFYKYPFTVRFIK